MFRKTSIYGAAAGLAIISCAIGAHVFILGIVVQDDGGKLFMLALVVVSCCCLTLLARRDEVKDLLNRVLHRNP